MLASKCPGQDSRYLKPEDIYEIDCLDCGNPIEFWKTDIRLHCEKCKRVVVNPRFDMGCAKWCSYAEQCLGDVVRGFGSPDSFLDRMKEEMKGLLREEDFERLQEAFELAESLADKRGVELIDVISALCIKVMKDILREEESQKKIEQFLQKVDIPERVLKKAYQTVEELEEGVLESLVTRILHKTLKLQPVY